MNKLHRETVLFLVIITALKVLTVLATSKQQETTNKTRKPNIILFVADDFGYGDLSVYGHPTQEWGPIDDMAVNGMRFTQFYATSVFCSPSRAAILTGRLPIRIGAYGDKPVFLPSSSTGLPLSEETIAESLQRVGYKTGMVGKWHLGMNQNNMNDQHYFPHNQGFEFVGTFLPFTLEDTCDEDKNYRSEPNRAKCFLFYNRTLIQQPINLNGLTPALVQDSKAFIHNSGENPFFLYVPFPQTHIAFFNRQGFAEKSRRGQYGDQVNEMQWAVGEILQLVKDLGKDDETLSLFISDHGAQTELCLHGGSNGPFYGGKGNYFEGGIRIPAIAHWPGKISPGKVNAAIASTLDIVPTLREVGGVEPEDNVVDGKSFAYILFNETDETHHETLFFFCNEHLVAVRHKQFKLHFALATPANRDELKTFSVDGIPDKERIMQINCDKYIFLDEPLIFNVEYDTAELFPLPIEEHTDVIDKVSDEYKRLKSTLPANKVRLFDLEYFTDRVVPCCNPPYCFCNYSVKRK